MKKYLAEFIGTCLLVICGCGAAAAGAGLVGTSLAFGVSLCFIAYLFGNVSGAHVNPAVSIAFFLDGQLEAGDLGAYIMSQIFGALAGSGILKIILCLADDKVTDYRGTAVAANGFGEDTLLGLNFFGALLIEIVLTCIFVLIVLRIANDQSLSLFAPVLIGLGLALVHLVGFNFTGTSVNPARSLSAAIFTSTDALAQVWVFIVGPAVGGALAALCYKKLFKEA
ncbi:MAG: aquaporin [Ruminococcus sp.]|nr:aquaporin [Ruminococcus sp.]